jgi:hypothetical protein
VTALEIEAVDLSDLDDGTPPCETLYSNGVTGHKFPCGKPAAVRVRMTCRRCRRQNVKFFCDPCYADVLAGKFYCLECSSNAYTHRET